MYSPVGAALRQLNLSTHRIYALPVLVLMPFGGCNCHCGMCDIWKGSDTKERLELGELEGWLEDFRRLRVRQVVLSGGEPLLHPDLWRMCKLLKSIPAGITLLTNGMLLERHAGEVARWCDETVVSLDGPPEIHDQTRGVTGAFDRLSAGVAALKSAAPRHRVTARCTVQRRNFRQMAETVDAAWNMGLDGISFLAADVSSAAFNRPEPWDKAQTSDIALNRQEAAEFAGVLEEFIAAHEVEYAAGFIAEEPAKLRRLARYYLALNGEGRFPPVSCNAPWVSAVVEADGSVRPCFFHGVLGNVRERPLEAILNSPEAVAFRRNLDVRRNSTCQRCVCTLYLG